MERAALTLLGRNHARSFFQLPSFDSLKTHQERYIIGHSREQMYNVVSAVDQYKSFLPWCHDSYFVGEGSINSRRCEAVLDIGYPPFIERYTSLVSMERPSCVRSICQNGRLFKHLESIWRFGELRAKDSHEPIKDACILEYQLRFESSLSIVTAAVNSMLFDAVAKEMVHAFLKQTARIYGPPSRPPIRLKIPKSQLINGS